MGKGNIGKWKNLLKNIFYIIKHSKELKEMLMQVHEKRIGADSNANSVVNLEQQLYEYHHYYANMTRWQKV